MRFIADFHIHSHYSIATSKQLIPEYLDYWAKLKGISVVGTGDFTHPGWTKELKEKIEPTRDGLYKLRDELIIDDIQYNKLEFEPVRFILTAEISNIYKKNGKVRKVHNVLFAPDFETVEKVQQELGKRKFNITSDGRPILGLDSKDLLDMMLTISSDIFFVPAHIWTPWFSVLGEKSGFDSVEECFEDLSKYIYAVETGLSSDPPMNWTCSILDKYTLLSNSDAHSPEKLGRNANIFDTELNYHAIINAIKSKNSDQFKGTIDLFPQEGKYHYAGHRKCGVCLNPVESLKNKNICPVCGKKITSGVMNRVIQLSDRENIENINNPSFYSIIPLKEIISEIACVGQNSNKVEKEYKGLLQKFGSEFNILMNNSIEDIKKIGGEILGEAIRRMRNREVIVQEGFDGEYGIIKVFSENELNSFSNQSELFVQDNNKTIIKPKPRELINFNLNEYQEIKNKFNDTDLLKVAEPEASSYSNTLYDLNFQQSEAVKHINGPALIVAGPGTGKTRVLTYRIKHLIEDHHVSPCNILAVTFTNKASNEMRERLIELLGKGISDKINISTFHGLGLQILSENINKTRREENFMLIDNEDRSAILKKLGYLNQIKEISKNITELKQSLAIINEIEDDYLKSILLNYEDYLVSINALELDDLIYRTYWLLKNNEEILDKISDSFKYILIDEYQDVNYAQFELVKLLTANHNNLVAIGDPDQAIYGFRGSDVKYINEFQDNYLNSKIYKLQQSYRCSDYILKSSENILSKVHNNGIGLKGIDEGVKIQIVKNQTEKSEAEFVARTIEKMIGGLRFFSMDSEISKGNEDYDINSLSEFAVLARTKHVLKSLEKAFNDHSIPYQVIGEDNILNHKIIKEIIAVARTIVTGSNILLDDNINKQVEKLKLNNLERITAKDMIEIITSNLFPDFKESNEIMYNYLLEISEQFNTDLDRFLHAISLGNDLDVYQKDTEKVSLMTLHASKGLEFNCVFIVGCENGILPFNLYDNYKSDVEEEKRLLYVGMTRAQKYLYITHADKRLYQGRELNLDRCSFLDHIEHRLLELEKTRSTKKQKPPINQLSLFD